MISIEPKSVESNLYEGYPRVLVIFGHPVPLSSGTGVTLQNLFAGWPEDAIGQIHFQPPNLITYQKMRECFEIPSTWAPIDYMLRSFVRSYVPTALQGAPKNTASTVPKEAGISANGRMHMHARAVADVSPLYFGQELHKWILQFRPEIIYSHLGSIRIMRLVRYVSKISNCAVLPHFMDDWPSCMYTRHSFGGIARGMLLRHLRYILDRSGGGLCISRQMADEYKIRYRHEFTEVMNCVDDALFNKYQCEVVDEGRPLRLAYCGGLHLGRDNVLVLLAKALAELNIAHAKVRLSVYVPTSEFQMAQDVFSAFSFVEIGSVSASEVHSIIDASDVNVHVESFKPEDALYTRLSISTKVPQYLASGRPILGIGPDGLASMTELRESGAAVLVNSPTINEITNCIRKLLSPEIRRSMGRRGRDYALRRHSANVVRASFRNALWRQSRRCRSEVKSRICDQVR